MLIILQITPYFEVGGYLQSNKQIKRIYISRHVMFPLNIWTIMEQLNFAEQKTETKLKNFIKSISYLQAKA